MQQGLPQVADGHLDERGRPEDGRVDLHIRQSRPQLVQGRLDLARHGQGVAPGLLFDDQQKARPVVDHRVADRRRRTFDELGHVAQPDRRPAPQATGTSFRSGPRAP